MKINIVVMLGILLLSTSGCYEVTTQPRPNEYYPATTSPTPASTTPPKNK
ncbi:MAG: hypothetical protein HC908_09260 [Calothrix sp. SM1_7_51]|nr:hypothetical protein [Calothrix sp. SM1_7_51]